MNELKASAAIVLLFISAFVGFGLLGVNDQPRAAFKTGTLDSTVTLEIADNQSERAKGLMNRESLCSSCGMVFVYPDSRYRSFWMKNTSIPLDIIFISKDRKVINIEQANPEPDISDENLTRYRSDAPAKYVIEVNQGFTEEKGINEGTEVKFRSIPLSQ